MAATLFRVHFSDGSTIDVSAEGPDDARKLANKRLVMPAAWRSPRPTVTKVKRVRENGAAVAGGRNDV